MRKLLSLMSLLAVSATSATSVVACTSNPINNNLNPTTLNGKIFEVKINSFTSPELKYTKGVDKWGANSIGALYSTLWSINNKATQKHDDKTEDFIYQNKEVEAYLTHGEVFNRSVDSDSGTTVVLNPTKDNQDTEFDKHKTDDKDWHQDILKVGDTIIFNTPVLTYSGDKVDKVIDESITIKIINA